MPDRRSAEGLPDPLAEVGTDCASRGCDRGAREERGPGSRPAGAARPDPRRRPAVRDRRARGSAQGPRCGMPGTAALLRRSGRGGRRLRGQDSVGGRGVSRAARRGRIPGGGWTAARQARRRRPRRHRRARRADRTCARRVRPHRRDRTQGGGRAPTRARRPTSPGRADGAGIDPPRPRPRPTSRAGRAQGIRLPRGR